MVRFYFFKKKTYYPSKFIFLKNHKKSEKSLPQIGPKSGPQIAPLSKIFFRKKSIWYYVVTKSFITF